MNSARSSVLCPTDKPLHNLYSDWLNKIDLPLRAGPIQGIEVRGDNSARTQWLESNHVRTEFLDAGIGSCWLAEQDETEAAYGETEDEAIAGLARNKGLILWGEAAP